MIINIMKNMHKYTELFNKYFAKKKQIYNLSYKTFIICCFISVWLSCILN